MNKKELKKELVEQIIKRVTAVDIVITDNEETEANCEVFHLTEKLMRMYPEDQLIEVWWRYADEDLLKKYKEALT